MGHRLAPDRSTGGGMKIRAYAFTPGEPPEEIQLWNVGANATDYGVHRWTERSIVEVFEPYKARGNPLQIDLDHGCSAEELEQRKTDDLPPTGGYAHLEVRNGAPWLRFDWSAVAIEQLRTKQRRFLSPEYAVDTKTGEIVGITRVSLVSDPGTHHARMLASAKRIRARSNDMIDPVILAALEAALEAEDPKAAIESLLTKLKAAGGDDAAPVEGEHDIAAAGAEMPEDKPVAAAAEPEGDKPVAAKVAASKPAGKLVAELGLEAKASLASLTQRVENVERDRLLERDGGRLHESIRAWASTQPLAVVQGLVKSAPADAAPKVTAWRA